jgi:hypothetical protein
MFRNPDRIIVRTLFLSKSEPGRTDEAKFLLIPMRKFGRSEQREVLVNCENNITVIRCGGVLNEILPSNHVTVDLQKPTSVRCRVTLNMANSRARL